MEKPVRLCVLAIALLALGCNEGDERLQEQARIEGQQAALQEVAAQNENLDQWTRQMEADLERRHRFFEAISGVYEGTLHSPAGHEFPIRFTFSPSLPRYPYASRRRSVDELSYELNNLYINAQVIGWSAIGENGTEPSEVASGCVFEHVRPDLIKGKMFLVSESCKSSYTLYLSELAEGGATVWKSDASTGFSSAVAAQVVDGRLLRVDALTGEKQSNLSSKRFSVILRRVD